MVIAADPIKLFFFDNEEFFRFLLIIGFDLEIKCLIMHNLALQNMTFLFQKY